MPYRADTALQAANLALSELGEPPIGSFTEKSGRARAVNRWYGIVRDGLQRQHDFGFCSAWIVPAQHPIPAIGRLKRRFPLPADCLKVRQMLAHLPPQFNFNAGDVAITDPAIIAYLESFAGTPHDRSEWDVEAASVAGEPPPAAMVLVTNAHLPLVNFSRRIDLVALWDPLFCTTFVKELAAAMAPQIAKDLSAGEKKHAEAMERVDAAARADGREESPRHVSRETSWIRSRYLGAGYRNREPF